MPHTNGRDVEKIAYETVMELIVSERIKGRIDQVGLAADLDVPQDALAKALERLFYNELLLEPEPGVYEVASYDLDRVKDATTLRAVLEGEAAWRAAGCVPLDKIAMVRERLERLWTPLTSSIDLWKLDDELHGLIGDCCDSPMIAEAIRSLRSVTRRCGRQQASDDVVRQRLAKSGREHLAILDALERGDRDGARAAMVAHIDGIEKRMIESPPA